MSKEYGLMIINPYNGEEVHITDLGTFTNPIDVHKGQYMQMIITNNPDGNNLLYVPTATTFTKGGINKLSIKYSDGRIYNAYPSDSMSFMELIY